MKRKITIALCLFAQCSFAQWNQLGPPAGPGGEITAIHRFNDTLYLGGYIPIPMGVGVYNGNNYGGLLSFQNGTLGGFTMHAGELIGYGGFGTQSIASCPTNGGGNVIWYDSAQWCARGTSMPVGSVSAAISFQNELYVGGNFIYVDFFGQQVSGIAKWNGTYWISPGFYLGDNAAAGGKANAFIIYQNKLYIGGTFNKVNNVAIGSQNLLSWDGSMTAPLLGTGTNVGSGVSVFEIFQNNLWIGGSFTSINGIPVHGLARYDGSAYFAPSFTPTYATRALCSFQGSLYIAVDANGTPFGGASSVPYRFFSYDGASIDSEETGFYFQNNSKNIYTMFADTIDQVLYAGGSFTKDATQNGINYVAYKGLSPLPVELANFDAKCDKVHRCVELSWETFSEKNNFGFDIERSEDEKSFQKIGFVSGMGNSNTLSRYEFCDDVFLQSARNYFYRLKQVDYDGQYEYTKVLKVKCSLESEHFSYASNNEVHVSPDSEYEIYDVYGKCILKGKTENGTVSLGRLSPSMYIVKVWNRYSQSFFRFVKQ